ncbi:MAG: hypothetical protein E7425_13680 [Ruminococcaceae bacterium]|nr:hypothetical protein [Oscillospiraceae bacterium]
MPRYGDARVRLEEIIAKELPETDDLDAKYPVLYPMPIDTELGRKMKTAIHFWDVTTAADGTKSADNHMQFLHFVPDGDGVKVDLCWAK